MKNFVLDKIYPQLGAVAIIDNNNVSIFQNSRNNEEFEIGSLTKLFTAELVAEQIRVGNIKLDDTLDSFFYMPSNSYIPTIGDLLSHFSGYQKDYFELLPLIRCALHLDKYIINTKSVISSRIKREKLNSPPTHFLYSNFGYAILGLVLEELSSKCYSDIISDYTLRLGLEHTRINNRPDTRLWDWKANDCFIAAGGITSTINDMAKFAHHLLLNNGVPRGYDKLRTINDSSDIAIGMSWRIRNDNTVYHTGCTASFNSYISLDVGNQRAVVVLLNSPMNKNLSAKELGVLIESKLR
jgi:CubicO group peptidase (beta-lactamase class C family)